MSNIIGELKELLTITQVSRLFDLNITGPRGECPVCNGSNSFKVTLDKRFQCFKCGITGSIIDLLLVTKKAESVSEAVKLLQKHVSTSGTAQAYYRNKTIRDKIFEAYLYNSQQNSNIVERYCYSRGWKHLPVVGLATSSTCLRQQGISEFELKELELLYKDKEYYDNHLVFPVYDSLGNLKHYCGRALDNRELRWKSSKGSPSIDKYFYNSEQLYKPSENYLIICEGISDCLSLRELGLPTISQFGINVNLDSHCEHFNKFDYLIFIYDSDKYEIGSKKANQYKSWSITMPLVIDLICKIKKPVFYVKLPDKPGIKDLNEWLLSIDYNEEVFNNYIESNLKPLQELALAMYKEDIEKHKMYWRLLSATSDIKAAADMFKDKGVEYLLELFTE